MLSYVCLPVVGVLNVQTLAGCLVSGQRCRERERERDLPVTALIKLVRF